MLVRVIRAVFGAVLLLAGLPLLLAGGGFWLALQHQDTAGGYAATLAPITVTGHAVVASDVDALLRQEAPFARSGRTSLRLTAHADTGPAFIGLARAADLAGYLADVPYAQVDRVRLARGPLPVATTPVGGDATPATPPYEQPFWLASSATGTLEWSPYELRGQQVALVVMDLRGQAPLTVELTARVHPQWLASTTAGLLVLGTVLVLVAVAALAWPSRSREIVYVVPSTQVPALASRLGVPVAREAAGSPPLDPDPGPYPVPAAAANVAAAAPAAPPRAAAQSAEVGASAGSADPELPAVSAESAAVGVPAVSTASAEVGVPVGSAEPGVSVGSAAPADAVLSAAPTADGAPTDAVLLGEAVASVEGGSGPPPKSRKPQAEGTSGAVAGSVTGPVAGASAGGQERPTLEWPPGPAAQLAPTAAPARPTT